LNGSEKIIINSGYQVNTVLNNFFWQAREDITINGAFEVLSGGDFEINTGQCVLTY